MKNISKLEEYLLKKNSKKITKYLLRIINSSNILELITLLQYLLNCNKIYDLPSFNNYINLLKKKIKLLLPCYIENELRKDLKKIFYLLKKCGELQIEYQIERPNIKEFELILNKIIKSYINNYSITYLYELKYDINIIIRKIEIIKEKTGCTLLLKNFFNNINFMINNKIEQLKIFYSENNKSSL